MVDPDRVEGCVVGQAVGDALGAPTEGMTRAEIRAQHGWVDDFLTDDPAGTDDTEYAVLTAMVVLAHGHALTADDVTAAWRTHLLGQEGGFNRGGFSEMDAIANLRRGLSAPASGMDNHELFSDGAAMRCGPIGAFCAGDPAEAARLAGIEARVSHDRDGVWCAQAVAAGIAAGMVGDDWRAVTEAARGAVPADSWTARLIDEALAIGTAAADLPAALDELYERVSIFAYPWADVGPEAVALAFGVFAAARGDYVGAVLGGVNIGRDADTIAAICGALAGALHGASAIPAHWREAVNQVRGDCIHATAGTDLRDLATRLTTAAARARA
jgi:ADP-ribosylglycohydrolase